MSPELQLLLTLLNDCRAGLAISGRRFLIRAVFRVRVVGGHVGWPSRAEYAR
jgi:hypothetical protein